MDSLGVLRQVSRLHTGISQRDNARMFELLSSVYPIELHRYEAGREHNGWIVPSHIEVETATIKRDGAVLFDGRCHPLAVAGSSSSFSGTLSKEELDTHVYYTREFPDAYVYHPLNNLRPWQSGWGLCIPWSTYREWEEGDYEVEISTSFHQEDMLVGEVFHQGVSQETIVFNAHTCHPCQVNDGLSGVVVILELFRWLRERQTHFSYLGVLAPEHLGTVFFLADMPDNRLASLKAGVFLESIGSDTPLSLQESFHGDNVIDDIARYVLEGIQPDLSVGRFRTVVGNDETVWEAPGIEVPMVSITRHPFPHYHTSEDNVENQSVAKLDEVLAACRRIVTILEEDLTAKRKFKGLVALSNPKLNLYRERANPILDKGLTEEDVRWGTLQDYIVRYLDGNHSLFHIAQAAGLPFEDVRDYIARFADRGLVELARIGSLSTYSTLSRARPLPVPE